MNLVEVLFDAVVPVQVVTAMGFLFGRWRVFDLDGAAIISRYVYYVALPVLMFRVASSIPLGAFDWRPVLCYALVEGLMLFLGFALARYVFSRTFKEALLLGMIVSFVNHVLLVLPIARAIYGEAANLPIIAIITVDILFFLPLVCVLLDFDNRHHASAWRTFYRSLTRNPLIIGLGVGGLMLALGIEPGPGLAFFARFLGESAPACALFALGVTLTAPVGHRTHTALAERSCIATMTALKLLIMPVAAWVLMSPVVGLDSFWIDPMILTAAGPSAILGLVLAFEYKVETRTIAFVTLLTTIGCVLTLTLASAA